MKINEYNNACIKFAAETSNRTSLDENNHFQTTGNEWEETTDGSTAGVSIKWAFGKSPEEITAQAPQKFIDEILNEINISEGLYGNSETATNLLAWLTDILQ